MDKILLFFVLVILIAGCCSQGDNACYKTWHGLVPDENTSSGYRYLTIGEHLFGEKEILEKNKKKP